MPQRDTLTGRATVSESVSELGLGTTTLPQFADTPLKLACYSLTRWLRILYDPVEPMKQRFTMFRRGRVFYCQDSTNGHQDSLRTKDECEARALLHSRNEAFRQPVLNVQIARAYLSANDPQICKRTWLALMSEMDGGKTGPTLIRHRRAMLDKAFDLIRHQPIVETQPAHFLSVLKTGSISTSVFLRRMHNFALDMGWLPWPVLAKKRWPNIHFKEKRAVTWTEHQAIVASELNPERRAYPRK